MTFGTGGGIVPTQHDLLKFWPVAAFIAVQTVAITWWARGVHDEIEALHRDVRQIEKIIDKVERIDKAVALLEYRSREQTTRGAQ